MRMANYLMNSPKKIKGIDGLKACNHYGILEGLNH